MKAALPGTVYEKYLGCVREMRPPDMATADAIAHALLTWAVARGATHYTHWFQPVGRPVAEKHDTFVTLDKTGKPILRFTAKELVLGEPDGSSFPNGGLRSTDAARGYTAWDPNSFPFVRSHENGATLYIPAVFFSWKGNHALDHRTVLLRSESALRKQAFHLFHAMNESSSFTDFHVESGLEQEFFLIDRKFFLKRPDLLLTGRTLLGAQPSKGQKGEDQYFGKPSQRVLKCLEEFEQECWKIGVLIQTRHREVAPGQYEVAPRFTRASLATDNNLTLMDILNKTAIKHGLAALLHPKPFSGLNGSGKHNNWSFGTKSIPSFLDPGPHPAANTRFMFFLAAVLRAVDLHGDLLRFAVSGAGNDLRLGGHEAPPAIVSVYLGQELSDQVQEFVDGKVGVRTSLLDRIVTGIPGMPDFLVRAPTDRNRTSFFAHTGNKFEFRAVGSSQNPSISNMVLNTALADSFRYLAGRICQERSTSVAEVAIAKVARETLRMHSRIVFNGDAYAEAWRIQAAKRGLPNLKTTPECLDVLMQPATVELFESLGVLSKEELEARYNIGRHEYCNKIATEARVLSRMISTQVLPVAKRNGLDKESVELAATNSVLLEKIWQGTSSLACPIHFRDNVLPVCAALRQIAAVVEMNVPADEWPFPTDEEMLFQQD
jgi:glutamine synthetase